MVLPQAMAKKAMKAPTESRRHDEEPEWGALQSPFIYLDHNAYALRTDIFKDGIVRCKGCNYILSADHITACKYCLTDLNNQNKKLKNALNQIKQHMAALQRQLDFLRHWDESFFNGTSRTGDVVIRSGDGHCFRTYSFVLASRSPVLRQMLRKQMKDGEMNSSVILEIPELSCKSLGPFMAYLLTAQVDTRDNVETAAELLAAANSYQIPSLKALCERYLWEHINSDNIVFMVEIAAKCQADQLKDEAIRSAANTFKDILTCPDYKNLVDRDPRIAADMLKEILFITNP